jgi:hypothetical protein
MESPTDVLSPRAREILGLNPAAYQALVVPGAGNDQAKRMLDGLSSKDIFLESAAKTEEQRDATLAGLWLFHDWLDESHTISQSIHSATGSFWHAIMHRREGDFANSKYWYSRVTGHPALPTLAAQAGGLLSNEPADKSLFRMISNGWNPNAFVDLVEAIYNDATDTRRGIAVRLQQLEWKVLFEFGAR